MPGGKKKHKKSNLTSAPAQKAPEKPANTVSNEPLFQQTTHLPTPLPPSFKKAEEKMPSTVKPPVESLVVTESPVMAAVRTLLDVIENYKGSTVIGLTSELREANEKISATQGSQIMTKSKLAVTSACAQCIRYVSLTLSSIEAEDVSKCREQMMSEGLKYLKRCERSVEKISRWAVTLVFDGAKILVHSDSLVVLETLRNVPKNIYFSVYIVLNDDAVAKFFEDNYNIDVKVIRDAEVGTLMESMDLVLVGAEAVLKNGGIINKVGTLPLAICAREMNKPMYVLAESFKFSLMYPISQDDLPKEIREDPISKRIRVDYTSPKYITFLITDRGLLTPTAVCDELIELYT